MWTRHAIIHAGTSRCGIMVDTEAGQYCSVPLPSSTPDHPELLHYDVRDGQIIIRDPPALSPLD